MNKRIEKIYLKWCRQLSNADFLPSLRQIHLKTWSALLFKSSRTNDPSHGGTKSTLFVISSYSWWRRCLRMPNSRNSSPSQKKIFRNDLPRNKHVAKRIRKHANSAMCFSLISVRKEGLIILCVFVIC
ncbi:hypothetical protein NMG60_11028183 [Bertholletia excelsa]